MDANAGLVPVQVRYETGLTGAEYVTRQGWRLARLERCPLHPGGGCGLARHTPYLRKNPPGTYIARWHCRQGHCTFSLLPDHLAARFPGTLAEIERVVLAVEEARSVAAAADTLRPDTVMLPSAVRWGRRRVVLKRSVAHGVSYLSLVANRHPNIGVRGCNDLKQSVVDGSGAAVDGDEAERRLAPSVRPDQQRPSD